MYAEPYHCPVDETCILQQHLDPLIAHLICIPCCPQDLMQHPDRMKWYEARFAAEDMPDWNAARFVSSQDVAPGLRR